MSHNEFKTSEPIELQEASPMEKKLSVVGIDIAQQVFHLVGMDEQGASAHMTQDICGKQVLPTSSIACK